MGLLDILNGMQNGPRGATQPGKGGMSPITMGLLALLAYKAYQKMSAGSGQPAPAPANRAPNTVPSMPGGTSASVPGTPANTGASADSGLGSLLQGGLAGSLGGLLAGAAGGGLLSGGLKDLLGKLDQNGLGDVGRSWVGRGQNEAISPDDLHRALDDDTIHALAEQSGMSDQEVLSALSEQLPGAIDQMTPEGRMPTDNEMSEML